MNTPTNTDAALARYYRLHARLYDNTRWSFLFGRTTLLDQLAAKTQPQRILEIGCGTGHNLIRLAQRFPAAHISGIDLSADMLERARRTTAHHSGRIELLHGAYRQPLSGQFDVIVCSYALSMMNPGWEQVIVSAQRDLTADGRLAVVDFHVSPLAAFRRWMRRNHVRMDAHLLPHLLTHLHSETVSVRRAYSGLWQYFLFIGKNGGGRL